MVDISVSSRPLIIGGGFCVGFLVGLTGVGAGSLMTPLLISGIGVPPVLAVGTDLLFASITKAAPRFGTTRSRQCRLADRALACGWQPARRARHAYLDLPGLPTRSSWRHYPQDPRRRTRCQRRRRRQLSRCCTATDRSRHLRRARGCARAHAASSASCSACLVALTSVGAGAIGVVALTALYHALSARRLVGTDIVHAIPLTFLAGMGHFSMGNVDLRSSASCSSARFPGSRSARASPACCRTGCCAWRYRPCSSMPAGAAAERVTSYLARDAPSTEDAAPLRCSVTHTARLAGARPHQRHVGVERVAGRRRLTLARTDREIAEALAVARAPWRSAPKIGSSRRTICAPRPHPGRRAC